MPQFRRNHFFVAFSLMGMAACSHAMVSIEDEGLSDIAAQSGLTLTLASPTTGVVADDLNYKIDAGNSYEATLNLDGVSLKTVDTAGNLSNTSFSLVTKLDVGAKTAGGTPYVGLDLHLDRMRLRVDNLRHGSELTRSFGTMAIDGDADIRLASQSGFFKNSATDTYLFGELGKPVSGTDGTGRMFYRQLPATDSPYLIMNNLHAMWEMPAGTLGVVPEGIHMETTGVINLALDYDILYKNPAGLGETEFTITGRERPLMHFGWLGSVKDAYLLWQPLGGWSGTQVASGVSGVGTVFDTTGAANQTAGLRLTSRWNFVSKSDAATLGDPTKEFRWQLGEAAGTTADKSRINFELSDWTTWGSNTYGHDFPLIAMDILNPTNGGPGGLCWGFAYNGNASAGSACEGGSAYNRQFVNVTPRSINAFDPSAPRVAGGANPGSPLAILVRKGNLQSYSRRITLLERDAAGTVTPRNFNWGLIYTLSNIDANIYLYPGGNPGGTSNGIIADIALMLQTFGATDNTATTTVNETYTQGFNWDKGFHFMIADTDIDKDGITGEAGDAMGIGFINSNMLLLADDTRIWVKPTTDANDYYTGGLDLVSPTARLNLKTTFGGGILPPYGVGGQKVVQGAVINLNMEGLINLRFSPSHPDAGNSASPYYVNAKNFLGYSGALRLMDTDIANFSESNNGTIDDGSFLSLAEPNNPSVDIRLANVTGDVALTNGRIDLRGTTEDGDNKPKLVISHTMLLGSTAATRVADSMTGASSSLPTQPSGIDGNVFRIGALKLGQNTLGQVVIPSAQIYQSITLKPQN